MAHTLQSFAQAFEQEGILTKTQHLEEGGQTLVTGVSYDSREVKEGTLFFCKGAHFEPRYLTMALEKGAIGYVSEIAYPEGEHAPALLVADMRVAMAEAGNLFYDRAWDQLTTVGITGTKGKSTTTYFVKSILNEAMAAEGRPESAVLSSIDNYDGVVREESRLTTAESLALHQHFHHAVESGISHLTMEVSSHALKYHRTRGVLFDMGILLNIGRDHISPAEHPNVEDYIASKMKIFDQCRIAIINLDQDYSAMALEAAEKSDLCQEIITFTLDAGSLQRPEEEKPLPVPITKPHRQIQGYHVTATKKEISFMACCGTFEESFTITLPGIFNVENALAAVAVAYVEKLPVEAIRQGLYKTQVDGRMEVFTDQEEKKIVIVDYAHNRMSYEALFKAVKRDYPNLPIYIVFGCPGGKAYERRQELGLIAGAEADLTILTEEDPAEESVVAICEEIARSVVEAGGAYEIIPDREEAIHRAIFDSPKEAVILPLAKGRETRQKRGIVYEEVVSDVDLVLKELAAWDSQQEG